MMSFRNSVQLCCVLSIFFLSVQCIPLNEEWFKTYAASEESSGTTLPAAPWAGFLPVPSTLRESTVLPATIAALSTVEVATSASATSLTLVAPSSTAIAMSNPITTTSMVAAQATISATSTKTVMTTIMVSSIGSPVPFASNVPSPTSEASSDAIQSTTPGSMSPTAQIGLAIGLTLFLVVSGAIAGLYFWRRRQLSQDIQPGNNIQSNESGPLNSFKQIFNLRRFRDSKDDAEWSIESVEKVSIVKNMRAQSVLTVSRSNSKRSVDSNETGTIAIGMRGRAATMALNSHPMTPSYTAHAPEAKPSVPKSEVGDPKTNSWPLPQ